MNSKVCHVNAGHEYPMKKHQDVGRKSLTKGLPNLSNTATLYYTHFLRSSISLRVSFITRHPGRLAISLPGQDRPISTRPKRSQHSIMLIKNSRQLLS